MFKAWAQVLPGQELLSWLFSLAKRTQTPEQDRLMFYIPKISNRCNVCLMQVDTRCKSCNRSICHKHWRRCILGKTMCMSCFYRSKRVRNLITRPLWHWSRLGKTNESVAWAGVWTMENIGALGVVSQSVITIAKSAPWGETSARSATGTKHS